MARQLAINYSSWSLIDLLGEQATLRRQMEICDEGSTMNAESRDREIETLQRVLALIEQAIELHRPTRKTRRTA